MKKLNKVKLVNSAEWRKMAGSTTLEKKINSYLASQFTVSKVPADECLTEAKHVIELVGWELIWSVLECKKGSTK